MERAPPKRWGDQQPGYTKAHSLGNKQDELETTVQLENYNVIAITEAWWDVCHVQLKHGNYGPKAFQKRLGRGTRAFAPHVKEGIDCEELLLSTAMNRLRACG